MAKKSKDSKGLNSKPLELKMFNHNWRFLGQLKGKRFYFLFNFCLEVFNHNPTHSNFAPLISQPSAMTLCEELLRITMAIVCSSKVNPSSCSFLMGEQSNTK
jgi:hypothetical protein